jgi:hypothetical protein
VSSFRYRLAYPIVDQELTTVQVTRQAILTYIDDALSRGIRVTGDVAAHIDGDAVICEADAEPSPGRRITLADRYGLRIAELAAAGMSDRQIAEVLGGGVSTAGVGYVRASRNIPSGRSAKSTGKEAA